MLSDTIINIDVSPLKNKDKDDKDDDKYTPPKEFRTIFKGTYNQPLERMWRIIYDDGRLPMEERETFLEEYTLKGKTDFNCTDWKSPDESQQADCYHPDPIQPGWKRFISYIMDIDSPIGPKKTRTSADEEIQAFEPKKIIIQSTSSTPDVPYGSSFNTIIIQCLIEDEVSHETSFEVYGYIRWTKSCVIKKSIEKFAFSGMVDHQKEMDQALKKYIEENPNPKYSTVNTEEEDLIRFESPIVSYATEPVVPIKTQYYSIHDHDTVKRALLYENVSIPVIDDYHEYEYECEPEYDKDMTTLNNNLVYDNILEIKEKELEMNQHYGKSTYCSSLAPTFNSSYVNVSERSVYEDTILLKKKGKSYGNTKASESSARYAKMIMILSVMMFIVFIISLNQLQSNETE